jgi:hypothetical protein
MSDKVICLIFVDDTPFFSLKKEYIDEVDLQIESDVSGFLGVHVERDRSTGLLLLLNVASLSDS